MNPIAGMGGRVGLKGTDGAETLRRAVELGAAPEAKEKAIRALEKLVPIRDEFVMLTCAGAMGEDIARGLGFRVEVVYGGGGTPIVEPTGGSADAPTGAPIGDLADAPTGDSADAPTDDPADAPTGAPIGDLADARTGDSADAPTGDPADAPTGAPIGDLADARTGDSAGGCAGQPYSLPSSTGADTRAAAKAMAERGVDLLLFAGGDGTARDVFAAVGTEQVALGIPAGVKIHSPVYANTPGQAGELALQFLTGRIDRVGEREVLDIDEEAVRRDVLQTALFGYLTVPLSDEYMQNPKSPSPASEAEAQTGIAEDIVDGMESGTGYIIGPGTTTRAIMQLLGLPFTLLGVDAVLDKEVVGLDMAERDLLRFAESRPCRLVLTPTGGQGYLLGRGNQQVSGELIKRIGKDNVIVVATPQKMQQLRGKPLLVDTGDPEADALLAGYHRIKTGYRLEAMHRIAAG